MRKLMVWVFLAGLFAFAAKASVTEIPVNGSEKVLISINDAVINIQANPNMKTLKVSLIDGAQEDFQVTSGAGTIEIKAREVPTRENFGKFPAKKRAIEIQGPSLHLEIHAFEGQVNLMKWTKEALLHVQKGRITVKESTGSLKVHSQTGDILIVDQSGKVQVDTYKSSILVRGLTGDIDLDNFSGETVVEKVTGSISLNQGQGTAKVQASQGTLQFELAKGVFQSLNFAGRVEGVTAEGAVNILAAGASEVNIKSQSGKVTIQSGPGAGSVLNLSNAEGEIIVPSYLKVGRDGSHKFLQGRLKGDVQKGSITVRSQNGSIIIK